MATRKILGLHVLIMLCTCVFTCLVAGCGRPSSDSDEQARVTSPNGQLDAVLIVQNSGGAIGDLDWYVFIVLKGGKVDVGHSREVFHATKLTGERLVWTQEHVLEIHYDIAYIEGFRNQWGLDEIQDVGSKGERDYFVEVQLKPDSPGGSLLTPAGGFR